MEEVDKLKARREKVVRELREVQQWLAGRTSDLARHTGRVDYLRQRAAKVHRVRGLQKQASELGAHLKELNRVEHDNREANAVMKFYNAVAELEEGGVDVGDKLRALMRKVERQ